MHTNSFQCCIEAFVWDGTSVKIVSQRSDSPPCLAASMDCEHLVES